MPAREELDSIATRAGAPVQASPVTPAELVDPDGRKSMTLKLRLAWPLPPWLYRVQKDARPKSALFCRQAGARKSREGRLRVKRSAVILAWKKAMPGGIRGTQQAERAWAGAQGAAPLPGGLSNSCLFPSATCGSRCSPHTLGHRKRGTNREVKPPTASVVALSSADQELLQGQNAAALRAYPER